ncbi:MAG: FGGY family carbohydrate kinase, partial [Thermofilaceae archaeon]
MSVALVFDCGSTNLRVAAVSESGEIVAQASEPNWPVPQPGRADWLIWDVDAIWLKLCKLSRRVVEQLEGVRIAAVSVTTWGADGALVER